MSISRSKFYVSTPLDISQRHSMLADISPASSASTLPSVAGSVDCLTDPAKKKKKKFSKSSFSLRPFFSSISSLNRSADPRRRDSSSQTTDSVGLEVGVQTQNAPTVDVPVQTSLGEWADSRAAFPSSYSHRRVGPFSQGYFAHRSAPKAAEAEEGKAAVVKSRVVSPLDACKVLKYASPGDSPTAGPTLVSKTAPGKSISLQEFTKVGITSKFPTDGQSNRDTSVVSSSSNSDSVTNHLASPGTGDEKLLPQVSVKLDNFPKPSALKIEGTDSNEYSSKSDSARNPSVSPGTSDKKPELQATLVSFSSPVEKPSALKVERTDSPVRHSAKIKTVHFDLSDSDSAQSNNVAINENSINIKDVEPACLNGSHKPRNLDKDFEDLLRNLDILVDDPIDTSEIPKPSDIQISFDVCQSSPPKQTLLSKKLQSAFDVLHQELLPPILETYENCEIEPPVGTQLNEPITNINPELVDGPRIPSSGAELSKVRNNPNVLKDDSTPPFGTQTNEPARINEQTTKINPEHLDESRENKLPPPTAELSKGESKYDSIKTSSANVFTSSKSDLVEANEEIPKNVYESGLTEYVIKTVTLPTLPFFFDSGPKSSQLDVTSEDSSQVLSTEQPNLSDGEEKMLSRSSSRVSIRSNPTTDFDGFFDSARKKFDSCENLDQLEEEIIRSLCQPRDLADMRRVTLDRLLSGDARHDEEVCRTPDEMIEIPESKINARQTYKHLATITKLDLQPNDHELGFLKQTLPENSGNMCAASQIPEIYSNKDNGTSSVQKLDPINKNVFYLSEQKPFSTDDLGNLPVGLTGIKVQEASSTSPLTNTPFSQNPLHEKDVSGDAMTCDYTHCLHPSEIQNSPFLDKISFRSSSEKSPIRSTSPVVDLKSEPEIAQPNGQCDFGHCLKPSQIQDSVFKAELSSQFTTRNTPSPAAIKYQRKDDQNDETARNEVRNHTSELTIVLQTPYVSRPVEKQNSIIHSTNQRDDTAEIPPLEKQKCPLLTSANQPPPPPPPLPSSKQSIHPNVQQRLSEPMLQNHGSRGLSEAVLQTQPSNLMKVEPIPSPSKSPIMMELEKHFETHRRHSSDELVQKETTHSRPGLSDIELKANLDSAPPPGAVLLEERVTVDEGAGLQHTDRLFGMPVREVLKETTSTAHFRPAPPKYEGIGPTEDGLPLAPRNSVKKENMHNWYKTMFKSLHRADLSNDNQEYVIGYSSEPETSRRDRTPKKKSSTLDNRSGSNYVVKGKDYTRPTYQARPRLIEDFEPGHSSVTDDDITVGYKRYLPELNTPKPSYEYKNGYEQENRYVRNLSPNSDDPLAHQRAHYIEIQRGGEVPPFGLGKIAPEKPRDPVVGPLPPPPVNYNGPVTPHATRPLTLPASCQTADDGLCQQSNGLYEMRMRQVIHSELQHRISPSSSQLSSPSRSTTLKSPDLKIPARALFDFQPQSPKEIPLKKDDVVLIVRQLDRNWYEGEARGRSGIFPVTYVEIVPPEHSNIQASSQGSGRLLYDFTAHAPVELSARKGDVVNLLRRVDANWYEARLGGKKGIVPSSYLHVIQEPREKSSPSPQPCLLSPCLSSSEAKESRRTPSPGKSTPAQSKGQSRAKKSSSLIEPVMYRALYAYAPLHADELELSEGDEVCVVEKCDDGWFVGTSARTARFGIFPGNYVERTTE